jgi:hypothetical protein
MFMNKEAEMTPGKKQETGQAEKKYLWFGFGNYGGQPIQQIGGGIVRDPDLLDGIGPSKPARSPLIYVFTALIGFTLLVLLLVWGISLLAT